MSISRAAILNMCGIAASFEENIYGAKYSYRMSKVNIAVGVSSLMYFLWNASKMKYMDEDIMEDKGSGVMASHLFLY